MNKPHARINSYEPDSFAIYATFFQRYCFHGTTNLDKISSMSSL